MPFCQTTNSRKFAIFAILDPRTFCNPPDVSGLNPFGLWPLAFGLRPIPFLSGTVP